MNNNNNNNKPSSSSFSSFSSPIVVPPEGFPAEFFDRLPKNVQELTAFTFKRLDEDCKETAVKAAVAGDIQLFYITMMNMCEVMEHRHRAASDPKTLN